MTLVLSLLIACGGPSAEAPAPAGPPPAAAKSDPLAVLPVADAADGTVDKVVSRCAVCGLGMDGDPAHSSQIGDYTLHSCSASCKEHLESDSEQVLARLAGIGQD